jgi:succinate dehydrogenase / fumarate reductase, cytochrome b subunit
MQKALTLFSTTIGKKAALAVSGLILFGFVLQHMIGNLQVFLGPEVFNHYCETLKSMPALVWAERIVMSTAVIVHVVMMFQLYDRSYAARPVAYRKVKSTAATYASATMKYTGPMLFLYIVFHILHLTAPGLSLGDYEHNPNDVYANFVNGFQVPWVVLVYVVANLFLGIHLFHGAWSLFRTLGFDNPRYNLTRKRIAQGLAILITTGNVVMPLAVFFGLIS